MHPNHQGHQEKTINQRIIIKHVHDFGWYWISHGVCFFLCFCAYMCVCVHTRLHVCVVWCVAISHSTCADLSVHTYGVSFVCFMQQFKKK